MYQLEMGSKTNRLFGATRALFLANHMAFTKLQSLEAPTVFTAVLTLILCSIHQKLNERHLGQRLIYLVLKIGFQICNM